MRQSIGLIGGDLRQKYVANTFNTPISYFANDKISHSILNIKYNELEDFMVSNKIILTPIPFTKDKKNIYAKYSLMQISIDAFLNYARNGQLIIGGPFSEQIKNQIREKNADYVDITTIECFKEMNAIPTCEGVLSKLIINSDITISGSKSLVLGYGQCGKQIVKCLKCLGSHVAIYTESEEEIEQIVHHRLTFTSDVSSLESYDYIINTIPKVIIDEDNVVTNNLFIDITNDYNLGMNNFIEMRGIPGSYSPITAGKFIGEVTNKIIEKIKGENKE